MRFNELTTEGIDPSAKAAIKGMHELSGDQYYGLYKTMNDVAGHDGKKQTAPNGNSDDEVSDKPFAYAYTDEEKNMIKGVDPKAKQITSDKSEELDESQLDEIDRRGFLKGMGAAAVAGAAGVSTKADAQEINKWVKYAKELLINSPLNRVHQDTGYDLRNWVSNNVSNWVNDYCFKTNSYNAKEVLDYSHKQGIEASGLDKQNALVTAFLTNMKSRCQDYLDAYRSSINEKLREYYNLAKSSQQSPSSQSQPSPQNDIKSLPVGTQKIIMDSILFYYFCKSSGWDKLDKDKDLVGNMCHNIKLELGKYIQLTNQKDLINNIYSKTSAELDGWKTNDKDNWIKLRDSSISDPMSIFAGIRKLNSNSKPEFESVNQGVAEGNYDDNRTGFTRGARDDERHDLDVPRPTIYALKINGKIWQKDGNVVTFFTKERALAARNSILNKRPELEVGLVQRQD